MKFFQSIIALSFILIFADFLTAQSVYKTPSGTRYHLETCEHVNNVSTRLTIDEAINEFHLNPCKICKPPVPENAVFLHSGKNKAVGACSTVRCIGLTKDKIRCKRRTRLCNRYCFQHNPDK
ncbi:MAG: hypothetical protein IPL20_16830 [Saprospiraceae bacterium]|nr:hypothetical protein [Saprospiraceae bacterium]